ncbi:helix-turn-helix domain-containing protein [Paenibacillus radicis (ex Xue et al. 2023)]|uniref:Helix-turn-helix domain-containing protein n=1 Tax=Paenibacillus radicis (ex Xue et al. 2023) TaxID=2972489 RepID=A0ABT1YAB9_9BACL|nr:helix-turn-helix domain-containing protein [Paenibacillus radicis (ex Xue et al. 2023)]MCR8630139.1 helix-turn-helix domain-containing protein [Paenibacillus radicis (ex Xue et al. 2023)]
MPKFLLRLIVFGIVLGAIPVLFIGATSYYMASGDIKDNANESNAQILQQTQIRVEQVLKTLELSAIQYMNSTIVINSAIQPLDPYDFTRIRDLSKGLYSLQTFARVTDASLINLYDDWIVNFSLFRSFSTHPYRQQIMEYTKHRNNMFWVYRKYVNLSSESEGDAVSDTNVVNSISLVCKIPAIPSPNTPRELLIIDIAMKEFKELLTQNNRLGEKYILDRDGNDFLSVTKGNYSEINTDIVNKAKEANEEVGFVNEILNGTPVLVNYRVSNYNGWIYVSVVSLEEITTKSRKIGGITLALCVVIFVIVFLFAWLGSRRMYTPIRRLFEYSKEVGASEQPESGSDELWIIEERFRTLSSTGKQLQQQIIGQYDHLKEFFVLKLFSGLISESDFLYRTKIFDFPTEWNKLVVLTIQIDTMQFTKYREHDRELLLFAINNIVCELLPQANRFSPILIDQSQVSLLACEENDHLLLKQQLHDTAQMLKESIQQYLQVKISIGISRPFDQLREAVRAYSECLEALRRRISLGQELIVHFEDIDSTQGNKSAVYSQLKILEDQLVGALKLADQERVHLVFREYMEAVIQKEAYSHEFSPLMLQLISRVYQLIQELGIPIRKVLGEQATIDYFQKLNALDEIMQWFCECLFDPVTSYLTKQAETQYVNIANQMMRLVHELYNQNISLESCAESLNFHPAYLSRVFKKELGINFIDYLAEYRMNVAKHWLQHSTLKISEVAEKVNYTNSTAFIRTFRKVTSMTPGQYRELHTHIKN